jgi:beta-aspartyl-peptidase (threonine type)
VIGGQLSKLLQKLYMKKLLIIFSLIIINQSFAQPMKDKFVLVIHGGAGTILKSQMTPEKEKAYTDAIQSSLQTGYKILQNGGTALDAVEACVKLLEDDPLFNAGKGAVFTNEGKNELDASVMDGKTLAAGAVAGVTTIKHPISAARAVMEKSSHVLMMGAGAEKFAKEQGIEIVDPSYFHTERRWNDLQRAKAADSMKKKSSLLQAENKADKYGTVGAVALDRHGNLAAATSTGGMNNKKFGRVGDSPIIGAGNYANNNTAAISGTGWGEYFIRLVMAKSVSDMMEFGKMSLKDAAHEMIMKRLPALGGDGGLIAVDKDGNIAMPFCTAGMYRGYILETGKSEVKIYREKE